MSSSNEELTPRYKNVKPLRERPKGIHTKDNEEEPPDDNEEPKEEPKEEPTQEEPTQEEQKIIKKRKTTKKKTTKKKTEEPKDNKEEEPKEEPTQEEPKEEPTQEEPTQEEPKDETEERKILEKEKEKKAQEYAEKSLKQMINGEDLLTNMQTFMESIRNLPENIFNENIENYAIVLSNTTINGEKIFNDVEDAKQFINKVRNGGKTSKRYIKPRARIQFKQEIQKKLQLTPMISRNLKHRTNAVNVYQY